jgi:hypothetical protein
MINKGLGILDSKSPRKVREKIEKDRDFAKKCYSAPPSERFTASGCNETI